MGAKNKLIISVTAALILVLVAASFYFFILKPSKPEIGIETAPQGWSKVQDLKVAEDAVGVQYQGNGTIGNAIAAFKAEMMQAGWIHVRDETPQDGFSFAVLKKNDYEATIIAVATSPNKVIVSIVIAKPKTDIAKEPSPPKDDVEGEDLAEIPRFPGSIRITYESSVSVSVSVSIEYLTPANMTTVTEFYASELLARGWAIEGMTFSGNKTEIYATKPKGGFVTVNIENSKDYDGYTNIELLFNPYN